MNYNITEHQQKINLKITTINKTMNSKITKLNNEIKLINTKHQQKQTKK